MQTWLDHITVITAVITTGDYPGETFVYHNGPGKGSLIASHCPSGPAVDKWGTHCPAGDWCADGYELIDKLEVFPGVLLRRIGPATPLEELELRVQKLESRTLDTLGLLNAVLKTMGELLERDI
jgi:hypothetical protein